MTEKPSCPLLPGARDRSLFFPALLGLSDYAGFFDFFSNRGLYELLTVVMQFRMLSYYSVCFCDHDFWDAHAYPVVFSVDGSGHVDPESSGRSCS